MYTYIYINKYIYIYIYASCDLNYVHTIVPTNLKASKNIDLVEVHSQFLHYPCSYLLMLLHI